MWWLRPQTLTTALLLDPAGGLLSPVPLFCPLRNKFLATPLRVTTHLKNLVKSDIGQGKVREIVVCL